MLLEALSVVMAKTYIQYNKKVVLTNKNNETTVRIMKI
jgi:hypothetical protein